ncbi:hypothetical protein Cgig2_006829 [Carnegiea gigantea]|uniref:rRNA N-glycosylase n=1 Tax=Carnegiea gigantea TaxID=171969 RepID=A0A9Q1Q4N2_9CARY|nr:hypothetical protein Cgig2_006829 [Carnegiea gigantea]
MYLKLSYLEPAAKVFLLLLLLAISILVILTFVPKLNPNPNPNLNTKQKPKPPPPRPPIEKIDFDFSGATEATYSTFIQTKLRDKLKDPSPSALYFRIPMLPSPSDPPTYIYVELKSTKGNSIKLGIDKSNTYVLGYSDKDESWARFFTDASRDAKGTLFPKAKHKDTGYSGQYKAIEGKAERTRRQVGLGIKRLDDQIDKLLGKNIKDKDFITTEAEFFLMAIQTVAEAVRFKYIEEQIEQYFPENFTPDKKVICLEEDWGKVSKAIKAADPQTGQIPQNYIDQLKLCRPNGDAWKITNANEIKDDMGLLNYIA